MSNTFFIKELRKNDSIFTQLIGAFGGYLYWSNRNIVTENFLIKTDEDLNIFSVKSYGNNIINIGVFNKIVDVGAGNSIVSGYTDDTFFLLKINSLGDVLWFKTYDFDALGEVYVLNQGLYLVKANQKLFTVDEDGVVINSLQRGSTGISLFNLVIYSQHIYLIGHGSSSIQNPGVLGLVKLDFNLSLVDKIDYRADSTIPLSSSGLGRNGLLNSGKLIVSSNVVQKQFLFEIDLTGSFPPSISAKIFDEPSNSQDIIFSEDGFYRMLYDNSTTPNSTIINKFDFLLNPLFSKKVENIQTFPSLFYIVNTNIFFVPTGIGYENEIWDNRSIVKTGKAIGENSCIRVQNMDLPITQNFTLTSPFELVFNFSSFEIQVGSHEIIVSDLTGYNFNLLCGSINNVIASQSPHLYLQSAGSTGNDGSTSGIHLRWLLKKNLIQHLPKGNLATTTVNYNKPDDFVKLYRAPYTDAKITFNLSQPPQVVDNQNAVWLYTVNDIKVYLYFRNKSQYTTIRNTVNPLTQPTQFLAAYGAELLELESKNELFFSLEFSVNVGSSPVVETEILSVEENTLTSTKAITVRKTFTGTAALSDTRMLTENGRSFRFRLTNCEITGISLEFYSVLAANIESGSGWTDLGDFSLSTTDTQVFSRLEPTADLVNGQWPRYNDDALVNIQNYKDKWNVTNPNTQSSIKQTVQDYINLSDDGNNPLALETFTFSEVLPEGVTNPEDDSFEIANLTLLQQASLDFHVARMLGLGHLDVDVAVQNNDSFVYMAVYKTKVTLKEGQYIPENTEHRYMTIPTSKADERLPVPVDLKAPVPGIFQNNGLNDETVSLTDSEGYTQDGKTRFISLFVDEPTDFSVDKGFYTTDTEFNLSETSSSVFAGIEYKAVGESAWRKPELPNTDDYQNEVPSGQNPHNETLPLPIPDEGVALYIHRVRETGEHVYGSYGINWFSRASESLMQWNIATTIQPKANLIPPHNRNALLISEESPLLLTSANEQQLLSAISGTDKTLIRLVFDYNTVEEVLTYKVTPENMSGATDPLDSNAFFPDSQEIFAEEVEIYFRSNLPLNLSGKALSVQEHPTNEVLSVIATGSYVLDSTGETIMPAIPTSQLANFVGGVLVLEETEFIIHEVTEVVEGPVFTVYKKQLSDRLRTGIAPSPNEELESPVIRGDGMFLAVENLQNVSSWGTPNPHPLKVQIGDNWSVHRELITREGPDDDLEQAIEKSRGLWDTAFIEEVLQTVGFDTNEQPIQEHRGLYKATFSSVQLANHPQSSGTNPVQWHKGIVRLHTGANPNGVRKVLEVVKTENIGTSNNLIVYFVDNGFSTDPVYDSIEIGNVNINYYPGYRIYLYADQSAGLTQESTLPAEGAGTRYTCFGFRSVGNSGSYASRISVPTIMFAQEVVIPMVPELPVGAQYATRPDSFGKATYTLTTQFSHRPHGIQYYRIDDNAILNALYSPTTVDTIKQGIAQSDLTYLNNRWLNLLGFDYDYTPESYQTNGLFAMYPENEEGYRLPNPDNEALFDIGGGEVPGNIVPGLMVDRIKRAIFSGFTPLTEIPLLFEYINDNSYRPVPKKQVVRDENGALLTPGSPQFDMAPMAKVVGTNKVQFTDFGLDGTSNNLYFYSVKELGNRMQFSEFSPILGPIKLVNTNPPKAPSIKKVVPVLTNAVLGIPPQISLEMNSYPQVEGIKRIALYRTLDAVNALSVRNMELIQELDLELAGQTMDNVWEIKDDFSDLGEIPYGDPIYYRIVAFREIEYAEKGDNNTIVTEYMPSQSSKLVVTTIVENSVPVSPTITYTADTGVVTGTLDNVVLQWEKTAYKATYYLYKMGSQGQWVRIYEITSNNLVISVSLDQTTLETSTLVITDSEGDGIFHHFKVTTENTSGLLSYEGELLTMP